MKKLSECVPAWYKFGQAYNVMPWWEYAWYSTIFMWAMHHPRIYLLKILSYDRRTHTFALWNGESEEWHDFFSREVTLDNCIRLDALPKSWISKKHLLNFFMLWISGYMSYEQWIRDTHVLLSNMLSEKLDKWVSEGGVALHCAIHPLDLQAMMVCNSLWLSYVCKDDCYFQSEKTDRTWYRIEFVAKFIDNEWVEQSRELINLVKISQVWTSWDDKTSGNIDLQDMCIFEWGGSFERVVALAEWVDDVFATSKFRWMDSFGVPKNILDILYTIYSMKISWYVLWNKTKQQKTYRELILKLGYKIIEMDKIGIRLWTVLGVIDTNMKAIVPSMETKWLGEDWWKEEEYLEKIFSEYKNLYEAVNNINSLSPENEKFEEACIACDQLTWWKTWLLRIVFQKLDWNITFTHEIYEATIKTK